MVEPPNAAKTAMALRIEASVRISPIRIRLAPKANRALALRRAVSNQIGIPDGARAECGSANPSASPTTCDVAAVPRN